MEDFGKYKKKVMKIGGEEVEGIPLVDIFGGNDIEVVARDGYVVHFDREEVSSLLLVENRILSPHEGLSVKDVVSMNVRERKEPLRIITDFSGLKKNMGIISGKAHRIPLKPLLPPSFSYLIAYSRDGYHASFSAQEALALSVDREGNLHAPRSRKSRFVKRVARVEIY